MKEKIKKIKDKYRNTIIIAFFFFLGILFVLLLTSVYHYANLQKNIEIQDNCNKINDDNIVSTCCFYCERKYETGDYKVNYFNECFCNNIKRIRIGE